MMYVHCGKFHHFAYTQSKFMEESATPPPAFPRPIRVKSSKFVYGLRDGNEKENEINS